MSFCPKIFSMHCTILISICLSTSVLHLQDSCLSLPWVSPAFYLQYLYNPIIIYNYIVLMISLLSVNIYYSRRQEVLKIYLSSSSNESDMYV